MYFNVQDIQIILIKIVENFLVPRFKELGMDATGEWQTNLEVIATDKTGIIRGRDYTQQLALGRRPGKRPPIAPIQKWAMAKFGLNEKEALGMAFGVATNIAKRGTTWHQKGGSTLLEVLSEQKVIDFIQDELKAIATVKIAEELQRNAVEGLRGI